MCCCNGTSGVGQVDINLVGRGVSPRPDDVTEHGDALGQCLGTPIYR